MLITSPALATHEIDHRYDVIGYVLDQQERPIADAKVRVFMDGRVIGNKQTDGRGFYKIRLHLHDSDLGRYLQVETASNKKTIRVSFTAGDKKTTRVHHANFIGGQFSETKIARGGFPIWGYGAIAAVVMMLAVIMLGGRTVRRRVHTPSPATKKQKRSRKRKRR
ncbi:MAG: hypothetical protein ACE5K1_12160 [Acidiferrobacterales bacterium]